MNDEDAAGCVNCDGELTGRSVLYCSPRCEQEASYVRYFRQVLRDGRWKLAEVREALRIRGVVVMNGGYPHPERAISKRYREFILNRDEHTCQACGGQGSQVDHIHLRGIGGNINHPRNLQVLCSRCHRAKTLADIRLISHREDPLLWQQLHEKSLELDRRVRAQPPERVSDDEQLWPSTWRELQAQRRAEREAAQPPRPRLRLVK
ncbi:MAG: HNH endonuclease [Chloroflexi bacterium]|nr:HNH endonuclease [Chloroflexota bacterium]